MDIFKLDKEGLKNLRPEDVMRKISIEEFFHILKTLNNLWFYDREALKNGKVGYHAILKSELCSDGFVNLKGVLKQYPNIRKIMAYQLKWMILERVDKGMKMPTHLAGVPDAATELGEDLAEILGIKLARVAKTTEGHIVFLTKLNKNESLLLVEDICSKATGITETINDATECGMVDASAIIKVEIVLLNRGGLKSFIVDGYEYEVLSAFEHRIREYMPPGATDDLRNKYPDTPPCPLCALGVPRDKPKKTEESWTRITTAQL